LKPKRAFVLLAALLCLSCETGRINVPRFSLPAPVEQARPAIDPEALFAKAEDQFNAKAYSPALSLYNDYLAGFPKGASADKALMRIAAIYEAIAEPQLARQAYERLVREYRNSPYAVEAQLRELAALMAESRFDEAIRKAAVIDPAPLSASQTVSLFTYSGDAYRNVGLPMSAAVAFGRAYLAAPERERAAIGARLSQAIALLNTQETETLLATLDDPRLKELVAPKVRKAAFQANTIGVVLPLSGKFQNFGKDALKGIELAFDAEQSRATGPKLNLVIKDTASDARTTVEAIQQLAGENQAAAIIGPILSAEEAARQAQSLAIPIVTLTQKEGITQTGDFVLRHFITPQLQA